MLGGGALNAKLLFKHPNLARQSYWGINNAVREISTGTNIFLPEIGFSHRYKVGCVMRGEHNRKPKPFVWTADPDRIIEKVNRGYQAMASNH
jgi:hypothetical protein